MKIRASILLAASLLAAEPGASDVENFLLNARIISVATSDTGVTRPLKASMTDGRLTHYAQIQRVDKTLPPYFPPNGLPPVASKDSWRYNVAAYRISRLTGLGMVPVTVIRNFDGKPSATTWWVDDVAMDMAERVKKNAKAPNEAALERQLADARVFDELILNIDRNLGNTLITKDWRVVLIDHTRSFAPSPALRNPGNVTGCSRRFFEGMKALTASSIRQAVGTTLTAQEISALLSRRDRIVVALVRKAGQSGEANVFFP